MISVRELTKVYGEVRAVSGLSFDVEPGTVTGFLGPNGAGKSTTMRVLLGLDRPTSGTALAGKAVLTCVGPAELEVEGLTCAEVGERAGDLGIALHHLSEVEQSLEEAYLSLTTDEVEFRGATKGDSA